MATPMPGRPPPRGKPLRVSPYGLHPPRLAAHLWTYTTSWDINWRTSKPSFKCASVIQALRGHLHLKMTAQTVTDALR